MQSNEDIRTSAAPFADLGVELIDVPASSLPKTPNLSAVIDHGFQTALDSFLADLDDEAPVSSLAEIAEINGADLDNRAPYGQGYLESAVNNRLTADDYAAQVDESMAVANGLAALFDEFELDAILSTSQVYAAAGFPALTVPAGYDEIGQPIGVVLIGNFLGEDRLFTIGYAFEQSTQARVEPDLDMVITEIDAVNDASVME